MGSYRNLIGDPISPNAVTQLQTRAKLLGQGGYQDESTILYKGRAHQAFIKLSSFVTLKDKALATALGSGTGVDLARNWTLFNGVNIGNGLSQNINDNDNNVHLKGYGQGGTSELGIRPMPGIISATISPAGMAGSVRRAEIKFRCHNLAQLDIIDVLYLRFGFSMLLEWGHTMYPNNAGNIVIQNSPIDVFGRNWKKEQVLQELALRRRFTSGNYDGMLGLVTNYEWNMTADGGYDCTLKLTGIGGVIESLKVNGTEAQPSLQPFVYTPGQGPQAPPPAPGGLPIPGNAFKSINTSIGVVDSAQKVSDSYSSTLTTAMSVIKEIVKSTTTMSDFRTGLERVFSPGLRLLQEPDKVKGYTHGFNAAYMAGLTSPAVPGVNFGSVYSFAYVKFEGVSTDSTIPASMEMAYIPLSLLLAIINNSCLAYDRAGKDTTPLVYVDFHPETNLCFRLPDQFSLDPSVCLLDNTDSGNANYIKWLKNKGVDVAKMSPGVPSFDSTRIQNDLHTRLTASGIPGYQQDIEERGNIMNILVNVDFVIQTLSEMAAGDEKQSVYLSQFLTAIMTKIAKVTGNINNFTVSYDDESNVVRIIDEQLVYTKERVYPTLPIFGLDSVVKSMSFKTEASSRIGSMLAIEAMAGERTSTTDGRDGSAFSALNSRLEDRLITDRARRSIDNATAVNSEGVTARAGLFNSFKWQLYNEGKYNPAETENNINFYAECMNAMKSQITTVDGITGNNPTSTTARGVLPLSINLTLSGISNIITREGFVIPPDRLPAQYKVGSKVRVGFVIADLTQTIQGQTWNTTIRGQMINLPGAQTAQKSGAYIVKNNVTPAATGGKVAVIIGTPPAAVSTMGFGLPLDYPFSIASFLFRQPSKTRGIAPTTGKDIDHYGYDMSGPKKGTIDAAISAQVGGKGTTGDIIYSISDGTVRIARWSPKSFGNYCVIDTVSQGKKFTMVYGHMPPNGMSVKVGDVVKKGTPLGYVGNEGHSFGHHLHFEIWEGVRTPGVSGTAKVMDPGDMIPLFVADGGKAPGTVIKAQYRVK